MKESTLNPLLLLLVPVLALAPLASPAQPSPNPPGQISYQGFLTDAGGLPLATNAPRNYTVVFRIYDASTAGTVQWSEQQVVTVDRGYFTVMLGNGSSIGDGHFTNDLSRVFSGPSASDRYIGMTVNQISPNEIAPRLRLLAAPYSLLAANALNVTGTTAANVGSLTASGAANVGGTMTASNFVGFGTIPIGGIIMWSGSTVPNGWALCNGANGTPNLQGRFVLGSGSGSGLTARNINDNGGAETHVNTLLEMAPHTHSVSDPGHSHTFQAHSSDGTGFNLGAIQTSDRGVNYSAATGSINSAQSGILIQSNGSGQAYNIMPPYYVLAYIMRVQ